MLIKLERLLLDKSFCGLGGHVPRLPDKRCDPGIVKRRDEFDHFEAVMAPGVECGCQLVKDPDPDIYRQVEISGVPFAGLADLFETFAAEYLFPEGRVA